METKQFVPGLGSVHRPATIRVALHSPMARAAVGRTWLRLEEASERVLLASTWGWVSTWLDTYGDSVDYWFAIATADGEPVGAALVTCSGPRFLRRLGLGLVNISTSGEPPGHSVGVEYNDVLCHADYRDAFAEALIKQIRRSLRPLVIRLPGFDPEGARPFLCAFPSFDVRELECPVYDLARARGSSCQLTALLRSGVRSRVRRSLRGLDPITAEWASTVEQAEDIFDELAALHQERWTRAGRIGAFSSERFTAFHRALIRRTFSEGRTLLFRVRHGYLTVGCLYCFVEADGIHFYQSGFGHFADNKVKPGLTTHVLCTEEAMRRGHNWYNFLAGDHRYKRELSTDVATLVWADEYRHPVVKRLVESAAHPQIRRALHALLLRWRRWSGRTQALQRPVRRYSRTFAARP